MGVGEAKQNSKTLDEAVEQLAIISGQRPAITRARKSIAQFKLRDGMPIGARVTLRGDRMWEFLDRLVSIALPRIRDFRGLSPRQFDGNGNYTFGLNRDLNLSPGAGFTYTGGTNATLEHDPLFALEAHRVYDVRLALSPPDRQWSLSAYGRNLGNEFYRTSVIKLGDTVFAYAGMTRVYGMTFTCDFR